MRATTQSGPAKHAHHSITELTVRVPASKPPANYIPGPPRWRTPEFIFYITCFVFIVPWMPYIPWAYLNTPQNPNYPSFRPLLSDSYIPGLLVDDSDAQYRSFRSNIPALLGLAGAYLLLRGAFARYLVPSQPQGRSHLTSFHLLSSFLLLSALHGTSIIKIYTLLLTNYCIVKALPPRSPILAVYTWAFCAVVLFANEIYEGYSFAALHPSLTPLDAWTGFYPRWHISFNITMLRIISFNLDWRWANFSQPGDTSSTLLDPKTRVTQPHTLASYTLGNYLAYILYPPLYIAGPIMTFNDYLHQVRSAPTPDTHLDYVKKYLYRFIFCLVTMEFVLHTMPVVAIKDSHAWQGNTPVELALIGFWNLIVVWLKLLIPWRFFRLWALADGIDPPENMVRCMANNYSALGFWRSWHRSYNLWIVRYIYIPVGGSERALLASLLVFTFVALWHDLSFRLLTWGWLVVIFLIPELAARQLFPYSKYGKNWWFRHICALGSAMNILMMMTANLVGFVLGTDGTEYLWWELISNWNGLVFMLFAIFCLFLGTQIMFEYREEELRQGIYRRC
ncbi:MBOAT-domain-containing protein [Dacryopinax primogenitus]|uniref:MBOAT-domain-containing protein n=1 Tax=Dacryopinax primogenitus (strain DJM 731) TaxID=1858805 RepID=M5G8A4_DACPD|nr:MBOAT-domain-containing protein [Dacryopinax primogenitus]EJU04994.1 MBOAT-domain-containing protein [Dacryopinax primogenitus]